MADYTTPTITPYYTTGEIACPYNDSDIYINIFRYSATLQPPQAAHHHRLREDHRPVTATPRRHTDQQPFTAFSRPNLHK